MMKEDEETKMIVIEDDRAKVIEDEEVVVMVNSNKRNIKEKRIEGNTTIIDNNRTQMKEHDKRIK